MIPLPAHPAQQDPDSPIQDEQSAIWDIADDCAIKTAILLHETLSATEDELQQTLEIVRDTHASGKPCEFIEVLARVQGHPEERIGAAILNLSNRMSMAIQPHIPIIPFGGKLIAPTTFYESYQHLHVLAKLLLTPVLYAEDTDAMGVGSINPLTANMLGENIISTVHRRLAIRPFVCTARLDYETWTFLTRKHFEL
jgi:hypothetical protein